MHLNVYMYTVHVALTLFCFSRNDRVYWFASVFFIAFSCARAAIVRFFGRVGVKTLTTKSQTHDISTEAASITAPCRVHTTLRRRFYTAV